jgi:hypothetical protein
MTKHQISLLRSETPKETRQRYSKNRDKADSTEKGYMKKLWRHIKKPSTEWDCEIKSYEEFISVWEKQKKKYGLKCPYTGVTMTHITGANSLTMTNISKDRLYSNRNYSADNLVFCTLAANLHKCKASPQLMINVLRIMFEKTMKDGDKKVMEFGTRFFDGLLNLHKMNACDVELDKIKDKNKKIVLQQESIKIPTLESFFE